MLSSEKLDEILTLQFAVAWAGESGDDEPRLRWWDTDMVSKYGGHTLLGQLAPRTAQWAALEAAREAARRADQDARARDGDPDRLVSLFRFGFELDEQLADRVKTHKLSGKQPAEALPRLGELMQAWNADAFGKWAAAGEKPKLVNDPAGRRLTACAPEDHVETAQRLVHALLPLGEAYPCPHYRDAGAHS